MLFVQNADGAMSVARWVEIDPARPPVGPRDVDRRTRHPRHPPHDDPAPPGIGPADRTAPTATVTAITARVRGRAVTVRLRLRSSERGSVRVSVAGVGRGAKVTLRNRWKTATALTAAPHEVAGDHRRTSAGASRRSACG